MNRLQIQDNACVVVFVPLAVSDDEAATLYDCLDSVERIRADRYVTHELRRRFGVCRGRLRMLLGNILAIQPSEIAFQYGIRGKPSLGFDTDLQFNVSHSQDWALMAIARGSSVGVDLEMIDRRFNEEAIASQLFNTEDFANWICLPEANRREVLLSLWVAKEAVLKSVGVGIAANLKTLVLPIPLPNDGCSITLDKLLFDMADERIGPYESEKNLGKEWQLQLITELPFAMAAVCFEQPIELQKVRYWDDIFVPQ